MLNFDKLSFWEKIAVTESIDFIVIGAGIVGVSTAINLRKQYPNSKIVILERGYLPTGASTKNAGFTCFGSATELVDDLNNMSESAVWETVALRYEGLSKLLEFYSEEKLGYRKCGSWDLIRKSETDTLNQTREKLAYLNNEIRKISNVANCFTEDKNSLASFGFSGLETSFHNKLEGEIRTDKLLLCLQNELVVHNIIALYGLEVKEIHHSDQNVTLETNFGELKALKVAITVNGFASKLLNDNRIKPARAQVLVTSKIPNLKFNGTFHYNAGYYYFRTVEGRILIGGGRNLNFEGETTEEIGNTEQITSSITQLLSEVIIPNQSFDIDYTWSGIMGVGNEKKPIIELIHPNVAVGVRMGGMGVAIGSLVGEKVANLF